MASTQVRKWTSGWEVPAGFHAIVPLRSFLKGSYSADVWIQPACLCLLHKCSHRLRSFSSVCWQDVPVLSHLNFFYVDYFFFLFFSFLVFENWCPYQGVHGPIPSLYIDFLTEFPVAVPSNVSCLKPPGLASSVFFKLSRHSPTPELLHMLLP